MQRSYQWCLGLFFSEHMNLELQRLQDEFGWQPPPIRNPEIPNWFQPVGFTPASSAFSNDVIHSRAQLDSQSWWYQTRNEIITKLLHNVPKQVAIWDVGSGTGSVAAAFQRAGRSVLAIEPSEAGSLLTAKAGILSFRSTLSALDLPAGSVRAVSFFDVLEHVENRHELLDETARVLIPGGLLVVTVPALPSLWSQFDVEEGHFLRYTKAALEQELLDHGFACDKLGYFFALTTIPLYVFRALPYRLKCRSKLSDRSALSAAPGTLGRVATFIERKIALQAPFGSSLIAIARRI